MPSESYGIEAIRTAAAERAEESSERATAAEIGMSYAAYREFIRGAKPQKETTKKLVAWYKRLRAGKASGSSKEDLAAASALLSQHIAEAATPTLAAKRLVQAVEGLIEDLDGKNQQLAIPALIERLLRASGTYRAKRP